MQSISSFQNNIRGTDLADMPLASKCKGLAQMQQISYYVLSAFTVNLHGLFFSLQVKKGNAITNFFQKKLVESNNEPRKI